MENVICWFAGIVAAYLTLRGIRGMWTTVGVFALVTLSAQADTFMLNMHNTSGSNMWANVFLQNNGGAYGVFNNYQIPTGGGLNQYGIGYQWDGLQHNIGVSYTTSPTSTPGNWKCVFGPYTGDGQNESGTCDYAGSSTFNEVVTCVGPWTNTLSCCVSIWIQATNASHGLGWMSPTRQLCPGDKIPQSCATNILGVDANNNGYSVHAELWRSGCVEDDYISKVIQSTDGGTNSVPNPSPPGGGTPSPQPGDPGKQNPTPNGDTNRTGDGVLHDDLGAILRLMAKESKQDQQIKQADEIADLLDYDLETLGDRITNAIGGIRLTNTTDTGILTNMASQLTNISSQLTNFANRETMLDGATNYAGGTNWLNQSSQISGAAAGYFTNAYNSGLGAWEGGTGTNIAEQISQGWGNGPNSIASGPLDMYFGPPGQPTKYLITLDPVRAGQFYGGWVNTNAERIVYFALWLRMWINSILVFVLWWIMYYQIQHWYYQAQETAKMLAPAHFDWKEWVGKALSWLPLQVFIVAGLMNLPTTLTATVDNWGYQGGMPVDSDSLGVSASIAAVDEKAAKAYDLMGLSIPWATIWVGAAQLAFFYIWGQRLTNLALSILRAARFGLASCLVLCLWPVQVEGTEVLLQNYTATNVVLTNGIETLIIPAGVTKADNLQAGDWGWDTNGGFLLPDSELRRAVVRFEGDTNGNWTVLYHEARTPVSAFINGYGIGWIMFGTCWAVSLVRRGLNVGARKWE